MVVSNVLSVENAVEALEHGDIVAIGRTALVEPEFSKKIKENRIKEIDTNVYDINKLSLPEKLVERFLMENTPLPPLPGIEKIRENIKK
ncbi:hypothetical protein [Neobacillus ginsengisoli]|uniref:2,4-dienoyl-CoA reductase-like NADH-dependent reductase (Old Yellow Enzyme family) n=1 Tax=Neobacillus ginsengisoli TaxID=904295 RepID=A0ABT9Y1R1_9BACI|nr:hypothetical protein [Neobacillus ginsengisoli]MDQ0201684.1 2,4-dienoyl-CoA reductase-like NADH-dependent reductase (Old Yellow Enzyme family) [Neobacillus ginsengisoli]